MILRLTRNDHKEEESTIALLFEKGSSGRVAGYGEVWKPSRFQVIKLA